MVSTSLLKLGSDSNVFRKSLRYGSPGSESFCPPSSFVSLLLFQLKPRCRRRKRKERRILVQGTRRMAVVCTIQKVELQLPTMHPSQFSLCFGIFSLTASSAG